MVKTQTHMARSGFRNLGCYDARSHSSWPVGKGRQRDPSCSLQDCIPASEKAMVRIEFWPFPRRPQNIIVLCIPFYFRPQKKPKIPPPDPPRTWSDIPKGLFPSTTHFLLRMAPEPSQVWLPKYASYSAYFDLGNRIYVSLTPYWFSQVIIPPFSLTPSLLWSC